MSKGSTQRPYDYQKFSGGYELIFGDKSGSKKEAETQRQSEEHTTNDERPHER